MKRLVHTIFRRHHWRYRSMFGATIISRACPCGAYELYSHGKWRPDPKTWRAA